MQIVSTFRQAIRDLIRWANNYDEVETGYNNSMKVSSTKPSYPVPIGTTSSSTTSSSTTNSDREMNFTITNANGGKIIRVHWYDQKLSREYINLHIVTDQEDLSTELAQIITRESLQR